MKRFDIILIFYCVCASIMVAGCSVGSATETSSNPAICVTNEATLHMLHSLRDLDGTGRILEMDYTADYKLDEAINAQCTNVLDVVTFMNSHIFDEPMQNNISGGTGAGCSAYAASEYFTGDFLMGRNYDFCHKENKEEVPISAIVVKTTSAEGRSSISVVDSYWLGYHKDFYTDGKSDLSMLMAAPYVFIDGMNEDGLAIGILHLGGNFAKQADTGKKDLWVNIAMRMILDKCVDVPSAVETLRNYNIRMDSPAKGSYHYFLADAKGHYSIIEYVWNAGEDIKASHPSVLEDHSDRNDYRYVTNFYVSETMAQDSVIGGKATRSRLRYNILRDKLTLNEYLLTYEEAMQLLGCVATNPNLNEPTSHTQWSSLYNLSRRSLDISILKDYTKRYSFSLREPAP